jgi:hypothetical protein
MQGAMKERWRIICAQAETEQDPVKMLELVREINFMLDTKTQRLDTKAKEDLKQNRRPHQLD